MKWLLVVPAVVLASACSTSPAFHRERAAAEKAIAAIRAGDGPALKALAGAGSPYRNYTPEEVIRKLSPAMKDAEVRFVGGHHAWDVELSYKVGPDTLRITVRETGEPDVLDITLVSAGEAP